MRRTVALVMPLALALTAGCFATREDVRLLQTDLQTARTERARTDSLVGNRLEQVVATLSAVSDSVTAVSGRLTRFQGDVRGDLYQMGQQLIQIQELTGQSQRRLQELRASLEQRAGELTAPRQAVPPAAAQAAPPAGQTAAQPAAATPPVTSGSGTPGSGTPGPNTLFELSLDQLRRGSAGAARTGFLELLRQYPTSDVADDAQFYLGEAYSAEGNAAAADSAYAAVVTRYPSSPRAPTALYKRAVAMEAAGNVAGARAALTDLVARFPRSDEAALARERLRVMKP